jgi:hypothetical protein
MIVPEVSEIRNVVEFFVSRWPSSTKYQLTDLIIHSAHIKYFSFCFVKQLQKITLWINVTSQVFKIKINMHSYSFLHLWNKFFVLKYQNQKILLKRSHKVFVSQFGFFKNLFFFTFPLAEFYLVQNYPSPFSKLCRFEIIQIKAF